jgi:hypothetical protein
MASAPIHDSAVEVRLPPGLGILILMVSSLLMWAAIIAACYYWL